jgi:hypothetical protein
MSLAQSAPSDRLSRTAQCRPVRPTGVLLDDSPRRHAPRKQITTATPPGCDHDSRQRNDSRRSRHSQSSLARGPANGRQQLHRPRRSHD